MQKHGQTKINSSGSVRTKSNCIVENSSDWSVPEQSGRWNGYLIGWWNRNDKHIGIVNVYSCRVIGWTRHYLYGSRKVYWLCGFKGLFFICQLRVICFFLLLYYYIYLPIFLNSTKKIHRALNLGGGNGLNSEMMATYYIFIGWCFWTHFATSLSFLVD